MRNPFPRLQELYRGNYRSGGSIGVLRLTLALAMTALGPVAAAGSTRKHCPCCGWSGARFLPFLAIAGVGFNVLCPRCSSCERHRGHRLFYENQLGFSQRQGRLLYFAPEYNVEYFRANPGLEVRTSRYPNGDADYHLDMMNLPFPDSSWDYIVAHRVIEHLSDDRKGMREVFRILKPGGMAILSVPITKNLQSTIEYGQPNPLEHEHYYNYGMDFIQRIPEEFAVEMLRFSEIFSPSEFAAMELEEDFVFVCLKPEFYCQGLL